MTIRRMTILWLVIVAAVIVKAYPTAEQTNEPGVEVKNKVEDEGTYKPGSMITCKRGNGEILLLEYREILTRESAETLTPIFISHTYIYGLEEECPGPSYPCIR
ncbi:TrV1 [Tranosema rostrale ichnovirus]|nr:TrV1 [Tranosema rostrale ichnovirus]